jgi:hypothetical protein
LVELCVNLALVKPPLHHGHRTAAGAHTDFLVKRPFLGKAARSCGEPHALDILERLKSCVFKHHLHRIELEEVFDLLSLLTKERRLQDLFDVNRHNEGGIVGQQISRVRRSRRVRQASQGDGKEPQRHASRWEHDANSGLGE